MNLNRKKHNGVNGTSAYRDGVSPGRKAYAHQVTSDRHQATAAKTKPKKTQKSSTFLNLQIGTWNVRTLFTSGQLGNIKLEMDRLSTDILGICETRWTGNGQFFSDSYAIFYSGGVEHARGVAIAVKKELTKFILGCWTLSDRVMVIKLKGKKFDVNIIQAYAPTSMSTEEELDTFYEQLSMAYKTCKSQEVKILMGDFNAKVGRSKHETVVGPFGLGERNDRGDTFIQWCEEKELAIMNTWFQHHNRRLYTWKSPGDQTRNQIDYICINQRFRNGVTQCKTIPSADCNTDHILLVAKIVLRLKKIKTTIKEPKFDFSLLKTNNNIADQFKIAVTNRYNMLTIDESHNEDPCAKWNQLEEILTETARKVLPKRNEQAKQPWMTTEILNLMNQRRKYKNRNSSKQYTEIDKLIKQKCVKAKEELINKQCDELEDLANKNQQLLYKKIKTMTKPKIRYANTALRNKNGDVIYEKEQVLDRWVEYIGELFNDNRPEILPETSTTELTGKDILRSEVEAAIKSMRNGKTTGNDKISKEMIEACEDLGTEKIVDLANTIYNSGVIPSQMKESVFITIPKKGDLLKCSNYRLISLMSHVTKIILRVLMNRIKMKIYAEVSWSQFGFRKNKGTRNAVFVMRTLAERSIEMQKNLYAVFIDYEKAFDRVKHHEIMKDLEQIGVDQKDRRLLETLYWEQVAAVSIDGDLSEWINIKRGVRQGCVLSPDLFSLYTELIMRKVMEGNFKVNGHTISDIRYADDTVLISDDEQNLQEMIVSLKNESEVRGLNINKQKTKLMVFSKSRNVPKCNIYLDNEKIKQVQEFEYLGSIITSDVKCDKDIKRRIAIAKKKFIEKKSIFTNSKVSIETRKRFLKCYIWSVLLYGSESWTISAEMKRKLEAMEMWCFRRMLKISWTEFVSNEKVLGQVKEEQQILVSITQRQLKFFGHIVRENNLERLVLEGKIDGSRSRGRQRKKYLDDLVAAAGCLWKGELFHLAQDRKRFRCMVANVT